MSRLELCARTGAAPAATFAGMQADALHGVPAEQLAEMTGVDVRTARRWKASGRCPAPARRLLALLRSGELGGLDAAWKGWRLACGQLIGPDGITAGPSDVLSLPFVLRAWKAAQERNRFALQADWIEGRYEEPGRLSAAAEPDGA